MTPKASYTYLYKGAISMSFSEYFPIYNKLTADQQKLIDKHTFLFKQPKGKVIHNSGEDCLGLLVIRSGQLRVYIVSDDGREITLYRLFEHDICLLSASCVMNNIQFDIIIETEKDSEFWVIPPDIYKEVSQQSAALANYANDLMAGSFSEVMWLVEQIMWKSIDKRLAAFLLEEAALEDSDTLQITHEKVANHMGTAREVVTRMLRYFQSENMVKLRRGAIELVDKKALRQLGRS